MMEAQFCTARTLSFFKMNNKYIIGAGSRQNITEDKDFYYNCVNVAFYCREPKAISDIKFFLKQNMIEQKIFNYMFENYFLIQNEIDINDRFSRNDIYYELLGVNSKNLQEKLGKSTIVVAGCGGIGNAVSFTLVTSGVKKLILIDYDVIELSNLNRQFLFTENDIGKYKVDVLERELKKRNPSVEIETINGDLTGFEYESIKEHIDFIVLSADDDKSLPITNTFCIKNTIPYINVGYINDIATISTFIPRISACVMCSPVGELNKQDYGKKEKEINTRRKGPSSVVNNFISTSMAINEIYFYLSGNFHKMNSVSKRFGLITSNFEKIELLYEKNDKCEYCS